MPGHADNYLYALRDLRRRLDHWAGHETIARIADGLNDYWLACACEIAFRIRRIMPSVDEYDRLRESMMLMRPTCMVLSALVQGCDLPTAVWSRPGIQAAARSASRVIGYTHDYHAGPRELCWDGAICYLSVLVHHVRCTHQEAMNYLERLNTAETLNFQRISTRLRRQQDDAINRYLDSLQWWIRGNYDWSRECGRYHINHPAEYGLQRGPFGQ
jgi:hypothetical protein